MRKTPVGTPRLFVCVVCDTSGTDTGIGRTRLYCSKTCRQFAHTERNRARAAEWYAAHRQRALEKARQQRRDWGSRNRLRKHGLTDDQYRRMEETFGGRCFLCLREPAGKLHIDHDHNTGRVRGLLCPNCNTALGLLRDDITTVARIEGYLTREAI